MTILGAFLFSLVTVNAYAQERTPLCALVKSGETNGNGVSLAISALRAGQSPFSIDEYGDNELHCLARFNGSDYYALAEVLMDQGVNPNAPNRFNESPIDRAIRYSTGKIPGLARIMRQYTRSEKKSGCKRFMTQPIAEVMRNGKNVTLGIAPVDHNLIRLETQDCNGNPLNGANLRFERAPWPSYVNLMGHTVSYNGLNFTTESHAQRIDYDRELGEFKSKDLRVHWCQGRMHAFEVLGQWSGGFVVWCGEELSPGGYYKRKNPYTQQFDEFNHVIRGRLVLTDIDLNLIEVLYEAKIPGQTPTGGVSADSLAVKSFINDGYSSLVRPENYFSESFVMKDDQIVFEGKNLDTSPVVFSDGTTEYIHGNIGSIRIRWDGKLEL